MSAIPESDSAMTGKAEQPSLWHRIYRWMLRNAKRPAARWSLGVLSFGESFLIPVPIDIVLVPLMIADQARVWRLATIATVTSVLGGIAGYGIGLFAFETIGRPVLEFYGQMGVFHDFQEKYNAWGTWIVVLGGLTPLPYKVVAIASGVTQLSFLSFILASAGSRAARFYTVAAVVQWLGPRAHHFIAERTGFMTLVTVIALALSLVLAVLLF